MSLTDNSLCTLPFLNFKLLEISFSTDFIPTSYSKYLLDFSNLCRIGRLVCKSVETIFGKSSCLVCWHSEKIY
jgi:hypothetical protein